MIRRSLYRRLRNNGLLEALVNIWQSSCKANYTRPLNSKSINPAACRCSACNWNIDKRLARKLVWLRARVRVSVEYN